MDACDGGVLRKGFKRLQILLDRIFFDTCTALPQPGSFSCTNQKRLSMLLPSYHLDTSQMAPIDSGSKKDSAAARVAGSGTAGMASIRLFCGHAQISCNSPQVWLSSLSFTL